MTRLLLAIGLLGCASAPPAGPRSPSVNEPAATAAPASAVLVGRMNELRDTLTARGVAFQGLAASGFIAHGGHVVTPFNVPAGRCLSIVSLASSGVHDLDAQLYDPDGEMLVEDVETDSHPTVQLCADAPRRVFHLISAYEGQGAFVVASFLTRREGLDHIARAVGGHPGTAGASGPARSELERRVSALRDGIARRGFQPTGDPTRLSLSAGGRVRTAVPVTPDRCYTLGAFADGDLVDVNVAVIDAAGEEIARDVRGERDGLVQLCPRFATTLALEAVGVRGEGAVVLQAWSADAAAVGGANALWLGERLAWSGAAGTLEDAAQQGRVRAEAMGLRASAVSDETVTLAAGDVVERPRRLAASGCTGLLASAGAGAGRVDLTLHDAEGAQLARGAQGLGGTLVVACGARLDRATVRVALEAGSGPVLLRQFEGAPEAWMNGLDTAAMAEAWAAQWTSPSARWTLRGAPLRVRVGGGARVPQTLPRAEGRCIRGTLLAGDARPTLRIVLRDAEGRRLNMSSAEGRVSLTRCGVSSEALRFDLEASPEAVAQDALWMVWDERAPAATP